MESEKEDISFITSISIEKQRSIETGFTRNEIVDEVKKQLWLAGPLMAVSVLTKLMQVISLMFVGHLGELSLSAASMATSFVSVTCLCLLIGLATALDTLCGQSYGAKQYHMMGLQTQRAMFVLLLLSIPLSIVAANTRSILVAVGQDPEIATEAGHFALYSIPSIFAYAPLLCLNRFLKSQSLVFPMMGSIGFTTLLHIFVCWILVFESGLGIKGAALANSISYWINVLILGFYVKYSSSCEETWTGFSKEAFHNIGNFLRLGIPSALMVCLEFWSFEALVLLSGLLPNPKVETSVLAICLNITALVWKIPFGLSGVVSTRVSNELGARCPRAAKLAINVVLVMAISQGILIGLVLMMARDTLAYAFSNEIQVVKYVSKLMPILATANVLDGLQCVLSGIVRGCGSQKIGAYVNLGSYYIVGIPSAILLSFVLHLGGQGLWLGITCGLVVQVLSFFTLTIRTNWEIEAKKATERVHCSTIPVEEV